MLYGTRRRCQAALPATSQPLKVSRYKTPSAEEDTMSQTHRALAMLALSLALVAATTAVAAAATPPTGIEDQHDRLLRNLNAAQAERTQAAVEQARSMERNLKVTPAESPAPIEDQHDRWLRNYQAQQAERAQADNQVAVGHGLVARKALYQSELERNLATAADRAATQPSAPTDPAPSPGVDVVATLLVGLIGGLVGGAAAMLGWTATTHRRRPRAAAST